MQPLRRRLIIIITDTTIGIITSSIDRPGRRRLQPEG
jgi:hypothetical protein